jgi:riboflavin biosynthesis pyrimidine reductase
MRTHNAHEAALYAASVGAGTEIITRLYRAVWLEGKHANELATIEEAARGLVPDIDELHKVISERRFAAQIVGFDESAYASGVFHVPTFIIGGERYAEQPYDVLRKALKDAGVPPKPEGVYADLQLPKGRADRPYVVMNMVATIDGKTVTGTRQQPVGDLGSKVDHASMRQIQDAVDAVLIGAGSLRATPGMWYPAKLYRFVATKSGKVDPQSRFFTDAPGKAFAIVSEDLGSQVPNGLNTLRCGHEGLCFKDAFYRMRQVFGIQRLLVEGGSEINAALLEHDVVDELFLTIAPKVKLGRETPTYAGGKPLNRDVLPAFELISERVAGDEVFLRYRRKKAE